MACPPDGGRDPLRLAVDVIVTADPALSADVVAAAVTLAAPRHPGSGISLPGRCRTGPNLLTGAGAEAPDRVGAAADRHACATPGRARSSARPAPAAVGSFACTGESTGKWLCRNCTAKSRAQPCARCGAVREAATRDEHGRPLCPHCLITDPANHETCVDCGRRRPVSLRTADGPLCGKCVPCDALTCAVCGQARSVRGLQGHRQTVVPGLQAAVDPLRWLRPGRPAARRNPRRAVLRECTRPDTGSGAAAPAAANPDGFHAGRCARCAVQQRLHELLGDDTATIRPDLQGLYEALAATERPDTLARGSTEAPRPRSCVSSPGSAHHPRKHSTSCLPGRRSSTCAASSSPPERCRHATNR